MYNVRYASTQGKILYSFPDEAALRLAVSKTTKIKPIPDANGFYLISEHNGKRIVFAAHWQETERTV